MRGEDVLVDQTYSNNGVREYEAEHYDSGLSQWSLDEIIAHCSAYCLDGVDFRGMRDVLDVTQLRILPPKLV